MKTIICISGLGGRANIFSKYSRVLPEFKLEAVNVIDWRKTQLKVNGLFAQNESAIFFCNCYGVQFALRAMDKYPEKISRLVVVEPFFGEFLPWRKLALFINKGILTLCKITDFLGLRRTNFAQVDYNLVETRPMFFHPFYDLAHQSTTDYFGKIDDILTFKLPKHIETKTLFIFSPKGFVRDLKKREILKKIFVNSELVEMGRNTHNIITLSYEDIAMNLKDWLNTTEEK